MLRNVLILVGSVLALAAGESLLKVGMDRLERLHPVGLLATVRAFLCQPALMVGMLLMILQFVGMLELFKYWDVSVVVPVFGFNFVLTALIGMLWLGEPVNLTRWLGISAITLGVALIARSSKGGP